MVAVAVFLERGHLNAPHTSPLSQGSLLKALLTQTQQHRMLPQWQPCLLPLKLHPVTRRSWTKHISLNPPPPRPLPCKFPKFRITVSMQELCRRSFFTWSLQGDSLAVAVCWRKTHVEFGYVGALEHAVTYKWHILYARWTEFKSLVNRNVVHRCVNCFLFRKDKVTKYGEFVSSAVLSIILHPLSQN